MKHIPKHYFEYLLIIEIPLKSFLGIEYVFDAVCKQQSQQYFA